MDVRLAQQLERQNNTYTLAAAETLTVAQVLKNEVIVVGNFACTLPTAGVALKGVSLRVLATAAATVVGVAASKAETATLAEGDMLLLYCNGTYWYSLGPTTAA